LPVAVVASYPASAISIRIRKVFFIFVSPAFGLNLALG
jgi:hypothetical protein